MVRISVRATDIEDEDPLQFRQLDELDAVRRQELAGPPTACTACGARVLILAVLEHGLAHA